MAELPVGVEVSEAELDQRRLVLKERAELRVAKVLGLNFLEKGMATETILSWDPRPRSSVVKRKERKTPPFQPDNMKIFNPITDPADPNYIPM